MPLTLFKPKDKKNYPTKMSEEKLDSIAFNIFKFNNRPRPDPSRILIVSCFSEFGCEIIGRMYCLPRLFKRFPGRYIIVMGWYGREYLYRHIVDEFWEIKEEFMSLRDHTYAFHHLSDNLKRLEQSVAKYGMVVPAAMLGKYAIGNYCRTCGKFWNEWRIGVTECPACKSTVIINSIFSNVAEYKKTALRIPTPSKTTLDWAFAQTAGKKTVGVFARGRKTYGRNLQPEFYAKLIANLQKLGYNPIWLGEKQSSQVCPVPTIQDFTGMRDLECTLALICCCDFTIQFWTASSRLAGIMGVPFILFESPEQIYCSGYSPGQEGKRLELTSFGPRKVVLSHYLNVVDNNVEALRLVDKAIAELSVGNYDDMIGMVENVEATSLLKETYYKDMS